MIKNKIIVLLLSIVFLSGCSVDDKNTSLYLLNVGDYINYDLLEKFEKEHDVEIIINEVESNEAMYEQIKMNRTSFDVAFPSDYMIDQLEQEKMIKEIDYSQLKHYNKDDFNDLSKRYGPNTKNFVPYFNGTLGIMYNKKNNPELKNVIEKEEWNVFFNDEILKKYKVGMYNSSRDAFAIALMNKGIDVNTTNDKELNDAYQALNEADYTLYGDDNLKKNVATGNLDIALVYSGDYYEELIVATEEENDINFAFHAPKINNYWLDGMVIPKDSKNTELAHKFIDFLIEEENSVENAVYIGYPSSQISVMNYLGSDEEFDFLTSDPFYDPNKIKGLQANPYKFNGIEYMIKLEEMFAKSKSKY